MFEDIKEIAYNHSDLKLEYQFNSEELCFMAHLLRKYEEGLPEALNNFKNTVEKTVYDNMSLNEALTFYS